MHIRERLFTMVLRVQFGIMAIKIERLTIPGLWVLYPNRIEDSRGYFSEVFRRDSLQSVDIVGNFPQENQSLSRDVGTVRGLHFQTPPIAQAKLIRVLKGAIFDVAVDLRKGSSDYGRHAAIELSASNGKQFYIPAGFAHGFCTLEPDTEILYKVSEFYSAAHDRGLLWCDPDLRINWPVAPDKAILSDKDRKHPRLADLPAYF
jgi:dTDP-4-dehydrorhamnose 3,5-epimerase